jgi:hypothetical protein
MRKMPAEMMDEVAYAGVGAESPPAAQLPPSISSEELLS